MRSLIAILTIFLCCSIANATMWPMIQRFADGNCTQPLGEEYNATTECLPYESSQDFMALVCDLDSNCPGYIKPTQYSDDQCQVERQVIMPSYPTTYCYGHPALKGVYFKARCQPNIPFKKLDDHAVYYARGPSDKTCDGECQISIYEDSKCYNGRRWSVVDMMGQCSRQDQKSAHQLRYATADCSGDVIHELWYETDMCRIIYTKGFDEYCDNGMGCPLHCNVTHEEPTDGGLKPWEIVAIAGGGVLFIALIAVVVRCCKKRENLTTYHGETAGEPINTQGASTTNYQAV